MYLLVTKIVPLTFGLGSTPTGKAIIGVGGVIVVGAIIYFVSKSKKR